LTGKLDSSGDLLGKTSGRILLLELWGHYATPPGQTLFATPPGSVENGGGKDDIYILNRISKRRYQNNIFLSYD
jgi:hypothetical protein